MSVARFVEFNGGNSVKRIKEKVVELKEIFQI